MADQNIPKEQLGEVTVEGTYGKKSNAGELENFISQTLKHNHILETNGEFPHSLFIWGPPGIGKTSIIDQYVKTEVEVGGKVHSGIQVVNIPVAMIEEMGDVSGMPLIVEREGYKVTVTAPPEWVPREDGPGILLFDDFNRAGRRIIQGFMQLVQEHRTINWGLPPGWTIICTGNPENSEAHFVTYLDIAQLTRVRHFTLMPDALQWAAWAEVNRVDPRVINFVLRYTEMLLRGERVNPRTYTQLGQIMYDLNLQDIDEINLHALSCLDDSTVGLLLTFLQNDIGFTVEPKDLINGYSKPNNEVREKLNKIADSRMDILTLTAHRVCSFILGNDLQLSESQRKNVATFLLEPWFPPDLRYAFCKDLKENDSVNEMVGGEDKLLRAIADCV